MNQKDEIKKVIDRIDQSQLTHNDNSVDVRNITEAPQQQSTKAINEDENVDFKSAYGASTKADGSPSQFSECDRFCKSHDIPESAKVQGQRSKGMQ
jgi:hypothetical protein